MPIHDWTRVEAGIFHHFHGSWIESTARALNRTLPPGYYALGEQIAGGLGPDVLTLQAPSERPPNGMPSSPGGIAVAERPPRAKVHLKTDADPYAANARSVTIRHTSNHRVVAVIEIVSPGNKNTHHGLSAFVAKAVEFLQAGIHLLIIDLFPPGPRDPHSIHAPIWQAFSDNEYLPPSDEPLLIASYCADRSPQAFLDTMAVGGVLPEVSVFLDVGYYIAFALEPTYQTAWEAVPKFWQDVITR